MNFTISSGSCNKNKAANILKIFGADGNTEISFKHLKNIKIKQAKYKIRYIIFVNRSDSHVSLIGNPIIHFSYGCQIKYSIFIAITKLIPK